PDFSDMEKLYSFLEYANEEEFTFTTFRELVKYLPDETNREYTIPEINTNRSFIKSANRALDAGLRKVMRGK
ncbi:MAG: hypothetical protein JXR56_01140, partial [Candidatus Cloacimonetes bacterium]|nr:hypothetical protein [Candidatus Cloacimonadota bacterium]